MDKVKGMVIVRGKAQRMIVITTSTFYPYDLE
jgi:hypothetical protein